MRTAHVTVQNYSDRDKLQQVKLSCRCERALQRLAIPTVTQVDAPDAFYRWLCIGYSCSYSPGGMLTFSLWCRPQSSSRVRHEPYVSPPPEN